jgi:hypothetical protein
MLTLMASERETSERQMHDQADEPRAQDPLTLPIGRNNRGRNSRRG